MNKWELSHSDITNIKFILKFRLVAGYSSSLIAL